MSKLISLLTAIKEILAIIKALFDGAKKWGAQRAEKSAKDKIREGFDERDTQKIEEALGHPDPGAPTKHNIPDLKTEPQKKVEDNEK